MRNDAGHSIYPVGKFFVAEDTNFVTGDSPVVLDIAGTLSSDSKQTGNRGYIRVDGAGDILVEISHDGTNYMSQFRLKNADSFDLTGISVSKIRLTWVSDSAYRVLSW